MRRNGRERLGMDASDTVRRFIARSYNLADWFKGSASGRLGDELVQDAHLAT